MLKSFRRTIAGIALLISVVLLSVLAPVQQARTPVLPVSPQHVVGPEDVVRGFYSWYLHELSRENAEPLKRRGTALKYLTPQLYANAPRLIRRMDADIFICAQDWDKGWESNFTVSTPQIKNKTGTATVVLPSGEIDKIKINLTLIKTAAGWRINKVACAN